MNNKFSGAKLPNVVVLTFPKTGSTSLYHTFERDPNICLPNAKETWFFDQCWDKGIKWYEEKFMHCGEEPFRCDFVSTLMYEEGFTKKLNETVPGAKFIVLLRDPVKRCFSHYLHEVRRGLEKEDFATALAKEPGRIEALPDNYSHIAYRDIGALYGSRITELFEAFSNEQIHIVLLEELVSSPDYLKSLWEFLETPPIISELSKKNVARLPRNTLLKSVLSLPGTLFQGLHNSSMLQEMVPKHLRYGTRNMRGKISQGLSSIKEAAYKETVNPKMPDDIYNELSIYYNSSLKSLHNNINKDLSSFWPWFNS